MVEQSETTTQQLNLYDANAELCRDIFIERDGMYGSFIKNFERFPMYDIDGLYLKCCRIIRDIEGHSVLNEDTLRDLVNYSLMVLCERTLPQHLDAVQEK